MSIPTEIQTVIDAAADGGTYTIPPGDYTVTAPIRWTNLRRVTLEAKAPVTIRYDGPPGGAIFDVAHTHHCRLVGIRLTARLDAAGPSCQAAIRLTNGTAAEHAAAKYAQTTFSCERVLFGSDSNTPDFEHNILVDSTHFGGPDANNDLHRFDACEFMGYRQSAVRVAVGSTQVHGLRFNNCSGYGQVTGKYLIEWLSKAYFFWNGGTGGQHSVADFYIGDVGVGIFVDGWNSEGSKRLLETAGPTGAAMRIVVRNCRADALTASDGVAILGKIPGPWKIVDNFFSVAAGNKVPLCVDLLGNFAPVTATVRGNHFHHGSLPPNPGDIVRARNAVDMGNNVQVKV